jgi:SET domain-containing protein
LGNIAFIGDGVEVRQSSIHGAGQGLFATRPFKARELITQYCGTRISGEQAKAALGHHQRSESYEKIHSHTKSIGHHEVIIGLQGYPAKAGAGGASYANHGPTPNTAYKSLSLTSGKELMFIKASTDVSPDDELFVSYGNDYWTMMGRDRLH